jgi:hypothetical protein
MEDDDASAHFLELPDGVLVRERFAEDFSVEAGDLVASDDQRVGVAFGDGACFFFGEPKRGLFGGLVGPCAFVDSRVGDVEGDFEAVEELAPER